jgi:hypothetical protein
VAGYPPHLAELGAGFFDRLGPGWFSRPDAAPLLHLPLWMRRAVPEDTMAEILEATALAYAYVRIQDNVVDEPDSRGSPPHLLVANLMLWDALALWRKLGNPCFDALARDAWALFSEQTEAERRQVRAADYPPERFVAHARKCALAEVPIYAVMAASQDWRGVEEVRPLVHAVALSYGRFNDVMGHARDLDAGAGTFLIAQARAEARRQGREGTDADVRAVLATGPLQERFLDEAAADLQVATGPAARLGMHTFTAFAAERCARLASVRDGITLLRLAALLAA